MRHLIICCATVGLLAVAVDCAAATPIQALLACRSVSRSSARLACFDRASARLAAAFAADYAAPARRSPAAAVVPEAQKLTPQQSFGMSIGALNAHAVAVGALPKPLSRLSATLRSVTQAADGRLIFSLSNGQAWVQVYPDQDLLASQGDPVTISRQMFGSYWLQLPSHRGCKVERVR